MIKNKNSMPELFRLGFEKRNQNELYDIVADPYCMHDLSASPGKQAIMKKLRKELEKNLLEQGDPRMLGNGDVFDSYPRFGLMRPWDGVVFQQKWIPASRIPKVIMMKHLISISLPDKVNLITKFQKNYTAGSQKSDNSKE